MYINKIGGELYFTADEGHSFSDSLNCFYKIDPDDLYSNNSWGILSFES